MIKASDQLANVSTGVSYGPLSSVSYSALAREFDFWFEVLRTPYSLILYRRGFNVYGFKWEDHSPSGRVMLHLVMWFPTVTPNQLPDELSTIEFEKVGVNPLLNKADVLAQISEQFKKEHLNLVYQT